MREPTLSHQFIEQQYRAVAEQMRPVHQNHAGVALARPAHGIGTGTNCVGGSF
jgi:hypothetical protein